MSDETPATPYGPAEPASAAAPVAAPAPAAAGAPILADDVVARARAGMRTAARVLGLTSIGLLVAFVIIVVVEQATGPVADITEPVGGILGVGSPLLAVVALNILVWRALVPGLARLAPSTRVVAIIGIGLAIAGVSVILLAGLLWAGVIAILLLEGFS